MSYIAGAEEFNFDADVFDSRDVIDRIAFLEGVKSNDIADWEDSDYADELETLTAFRDEVQGYVPDWKYGETFISDDHFQDYAEEMAYDIGAIDREATWPLNRIDWEAAADDLKIDYTSYELRGVTYWAR